MTKRAPSKTRSASMRAHWDDPLKYVLHVRAIRARAPRALKLNLSPKAVYQREYMRRYRENRDTQ